MGRKSTKNNKNIYQIARDDAELTRAAVEDKTQGVLSANRIEHIENGSTNVNPEDIVIMADVYNKPELYNYYCRNECQIGARFVPEVQTIHDLPRISLQLLSGINTLDRDKDRVIEIVADGRISKEEKADFELFRQHLSDMSLAIEALKLWAEKEVHDNI